VVKVSARVLSRSLCKPKPRILQALAKCCPLKSIVTKPGTAMNRSTVKIFTYTYCHLEVDHRARRKEDTVRTRKLEFEQKQLVGRTMCSPTYHTYACGESNGPQRRSTVLRLGLVGLIINLSYVSINCENLNQRYFSKSLMQQQRLWTIQKPLSDLQLSGLFSNLFYSF